MSQRLPAAALGLAVSCGLQNAISMHTQMLLVQVRLFRRLGNPVAQELAEGYLKEQKNAKKVVEA